MTKKHLATLLLAASLSASLAACDDSGSDRLRLSTGPSDGESSGDVARDVAFDAAFAVVRFYSGLEARQRLVIRDAAEWERVWGEMTERFGDPPPAPTVDFAQSMLLVAAMGQRNSGGFSIRIDSVRIANGVARAVVTERSPGNDCVVTGALTQPTDAVLVPRAAQVVWVERSEVVPCGR